MPTLWKNRGSFEVRGYWNVGWLSDDDGTLVVVVAQSILRLSPRDFAESFIHVQVHRLVHRAMRLVVVELVEDGLLGKFPRS